MRFYIRLLFLFLYCLHLNIISANIGGRQVDNYYVILEDSPKKARALIGSKSCLYVSKELARAGDVVLARGKRIHFDNQS